MNILQCHSRGDKRFSAFCAFVNGASIESLYQGAKRDEHQRPFARPKGQQASYLSIAEEMYPWTPELAYGYYRMLWHLYFLEYPDLRQLAAQYEGYFDKFERGGARTYSWRDDHLPLKCLQSVAIADIVRHGKRGERYSYPPELKAFWQMERETALAKHTL